MEYKFRRREGQPSTYRAPSANFTYFTEQAIRAGYSNNNFGLPHDYFRNPNDMREVIRWEMDKERIREEIIAAEIARKRVLEAEVRREMALEREMSFRRGDGFSFLSHRFEAHHRLPVLHQPEGRSFEERIASSLGERLGQPSRREIGGLNMLPFQRHKEPQTAENVLVPEDNQGKVFILGKPNTNATGVKRKAVTPPAEATSEFALVGLKKQPKVEWSCAICQVSATSERGLNEHLGGKKHKAKEAGLMAQKTGKNFGIGLVPKKMPTPNKLSETNATASFVQGIKIEKKSPLRKKKTLLHLKQQDTDVSNTEDGKVEESRKNKFKFWCEMCQAGAFSEKVMNHHKKGKKHAGRLLELKKNVGATSAIREAVKPSEEVAEEETVTKEDLVVVTLEEAVKPSEEVAEEETVTKEDLVVVTLDETANVKVSENLAEEETKDALVKVNGMENEAHLESQAVADIGSV